ncbi:MAG: class I SAM-dependent methyltransferase [bacterium]
MSVPAQASWLGEPFVVGTRGQFAAARSALERIGFTEAAICAGAGIGTIYELAGRRDREAGFLEHDTPLSMAVQLFMDGEDLSWDTVRGVIAAHDLSALEAVGLLQSVPGDSTRCAAFVALYPTEGLYVASDRHARIQLVATGTPADLVYSALTPETQRFVELMPRVPCGDYLELCSGTGIAALLAARDFAERAWAVDITERSTRFAAFNAALNGLENVHAIAGDLYAPVMERTFDVITAHPPYVPSFETAMVFRDGGEDGEQVTRKILAGLAEHLRPGGRFYCDCMMTDRVGAPLEQRIREMLGPRHAEFDVLVGQIGLIEPEALLGGSVASGRSGEAAVATQRSLFERLGVERFVNVGFLVRRRPTPGTPVTRRRVVSVGTRATHLDRFLHYSSAVSDWERGSSRFLDARPRSSSHTEFLTRSVLRDGRWTVAAASLATLVPFSVQAECPSWFGTFLTWCDGRSTARALLLRLRNAGIVADAAADLDFAILIGELADGGFIELDVLPFSGEAAEP